MCDGIQSQPYKYTSVASSQIDYLPWHADYLQFEMIKLMNNNYQYKTNTKARQMKVQEPMRTTVKGKHIDYNKLRSNANTEFRNTILNKVKTNEKFTWVISCQ